MKKIFRMALVFALAGATLMYTGCTKDYGEDIDKLDSDVTALRNDLTGKLGELSNEVSSLRSTVSALDAAYKAADKALEEKLQGNIDASVKTLSDRLTAVEEKVKDLEKFATKEELKEAKEALEQKIAEDLKALKEEITGVTDGLQKQLDAFKEELAKKVGLEDFEALKAELAKYALKEDVEALKAELAKKANVADIDAKIKEIEDAQKEIDNVYGFLSDELRAIVFYPDFYFGGIEATSYDFATFWGYYAYAYTNQSGKTADYEIPGSDPKKVVKKDAPIYRDWLYYIDDKGNEKFILDEDGNAVLGPDGKPIANKQYGEYWYWKDHIDGQVARALYDLNPSSFPLDSAEWSLKGDNKRYVVKADDEDLTWTPVFESIDKVNGHAEVRYSIEHPELLFSTFISSFYRSNRITGFIGQIARLPDDNIPIMQLVGTLSDGREIVSDWHAVTKGEEFVDHLAFVTKTPYYTGYAEITEDEEECNIVDALGKAKDLFPNGIDAIMALDEFTVAVKYNGGPFNLADIIAVHTSDNGIINDYTLDEFTAKYPGYSYRFTLVPYTIGGKSTREDQYAKLDGDWFIPCYVDPSSGKIVSVPIEKDDESTLGKSAVGRMPVIMAELVDEDGFAYAIGWFKVYISKDARAPRFFDLPDLPKVPFICNNFTLATTWDQFSFFVLEKLGMDYIEFAGTYTFEGIWGYKGKLNAAGTGVETVFDKLVPASAPVYNASKKYDEYKQNVIFDSYEMTPMGPQLKSVNYGVATYIQDKSGSGINDAFEWAVSPQGIGEGKTNTIYYRFVNGDDVIYFAMNATVAKRAGLTFVGNKQANYWFSDITDAVANNTVRMNVPVATADKTTPVVGGDVLLFQRDINLNFNTERPKLYLSADSDPVYQKYFTNPATAGYPAAELATTTTFLFDVDQPKINGVQLFTNWWDEDEPCTKLYAEHKNAQGKVVMQTVTYKGEDIEVPATTDLIAEIVVDGTSAATGLPIQLMKYNNGREVDNTVAKQLLNLWSYKQTDETKMLYANIVAVNTYGTCGIELEDGHFHMRYIRPLDVDFTEQDVADESAVDGFNVEIAKFISGITDWNSQAVIVKEMVDETAADGTVTKVWSGYYIPNIIRSVDMYEYYGFKTLKIDLTKAERNNNSFDNPEKWQKISEATPSARFAFGSVELVDASGEPIDPKDWIFTDMTPADKKVSIDITDFNDLRGLVLNYRNAEGYSSTFKIRVPVEVEYAWGTLKEYLVINIKDTGETTPNTGA